MRHLCYGKGCPGLYPTYLAGNRTIYRCPGIVIDGHLAVGSEPLKGADLDPPTENVLSLALGFVISNVPEERNCLGSLFTAVKSSEAKTDNLTVVPMLEINLPEADVRNCPQETVCYARLEV
ncbi:hypothetical protein UY3_17699 [Chelonia mydas]|uniref:Uncharacterized protein n=1 Tax=Chelonia mydas TaxID=8469 RepID=M7AJH5_CHEMY|nr:hypothetical protein UY3_17699 [Chelonia mydas]